MRERYGPEDYDDINTQNVRCGNIANPICQELDLAVGEQVSFPPSSQGCEQPPELNVNTNASLSELESPLTSPFVPFGCTSLSELAADGPNPQPTDAPSKNSQSHSTGRLPVVSPSARIRMQELHSVFEVVHERWTTRLSQIPELYQTCCSLPSDALFRTGLQTWRSVIKNQSPETFDATTAFMLVAVACAFTTCGDCNMPAWCDLLLSIMEWRHLVSDYIERERFVWAMRQFIGNPQETRMLACREEELLASCPSVYSLKREPSHRGSCNGGSALVEVNAANQPSDAPSDASTLLSRLKIGQAFRACIKFLDSKLKSHDFDISCY